MTGPESQPRASFWIGERPLVLASGSTARHAVLDAAGVPHIVEPAAIDEREIEGPLRDAGASPAAIASHLAEAKARAVSGMRPDHVVLGADQTLALGDRLFTKAADLAEARQALQTLSAQTHSLHSAWALARGGEVLEVGMSTARLTMRELGPDFLDAYVAREGTGLTASVGAYRLEGLGIHLFDAMEGDHTTILGLPMLQVLAALRRLGCLLG